MKRRNFLAAAGLAGFAPLANLAQAKAPADDSNKQYIELVLIKMASQAKQKALDDFLREAFIPALNRMGVEPVGAFSASEGDNPDTYLLKPYDSLEAVVAVLQRLGEDEEFFRAAADFLNAPLSDPAYERIESSLLLAFDECPKVEVPTKKASRVFQLRIYESHNYERANKKVEMFNAGGEIDIFRRDGMPPVFFGQTLIGTKIPNLTYMLGFDDPDALKAGWAKFLKDPAWTKLKKDPAYKDTVSNITNLVLRPLSSSQI